MPLPELKGTLTDIGTEELGHLEMIGAIVYQLTRNLTIDEIKKAGFEDYFVDHTTEYIHRVQTVFRLQLPPCKAKGTQ